MTGVAAELAAAYHAVFTARGVPYRGFGHFGFGGASAPRARRPEGSPPRRTRGLQPFDS